MFCEVSNIFLNLHISVLRFLGIVMSNGEDEIIDVSDIDTSDKSEDSDPEDDPRIKLLKLDRRNSLQLEGCVLDIYRCDESPICRLANYTVIVSSAVFLRKDLPLISVRRALCLQSNPNNDGQVDMQDPVPSFNSKDTGKHNSLRFMFAKEDSSEEALLIPVDQHDKWFFLYILHDSKTKLHEWINNQENLQNIKVQASRDSTLKRLCEQWREWVPEALKIKLTHPDTLYMTKIIAVHPDTIEVV